MSKSIILTILSVELQPYVESVSIDTERKFTPSRVTKRNAKAKETFSDHFACIINLKDLNKTKTKKENKRKVWNLKKIGGWDKYKEVSDRRSKDVLKVLEKEELSVEEIHDKFEKINNKIKFEAFGKVTIGDHRIETTEEKEDKDPEQVFEEQVLKAKEEIERMKGLNKGKAANVWDVRKKIMGNQKTIEATAIVNPNTNKKVVGKNEIKKVILEYCQKTLENNKPEDDYKEKIKSKESAMKEMLKQTDGEFEAEFGVYESLLNKFKISGKKNYDFITKAGKLYQEAVFYLCKRMILEEVFPESFKQTILHMIYKGKGRRENLSENRFIHSKTWLPRVVEGLVVQGGLREPLLEKSSAYQIGGQPGHRVEEHLFSMKSLIARSRAQGKAVVLQMFDLEKFFDKEMMQDAFLTCRQRDADAKAVRCWYKLNEDTVIRVRTGVGLSEPGEVGAVIGQGTIGGALVSQAVLDSALMEQFQPGGEEELNYGTVKMAPLVFQDDFLHASDEIEKARQTNVKINKMIKQRGLNLNQKKSVCLMIGSKKQKKDMSKKLEEDPLKCGDVETKEVESDKWLGQIISAKGLADSVNKTIEAKESKIKAACLEIADIIQDWRSQAIGGIDSALLMWEACCIPSLLTGAGTWVNITPAAERRLEALQHWFLRLVLRVGPGCPNPSLR